MTASALGMPLAASVVPSSGSTAMSTCGGLPSPMRSPLNSIGASSFSPSPMTTVPSMLTVPSTSRMASTAAWSAPSLSPRPTIRAAARAAASVVRTSSRARLRSGCEGCTLMAPQPMWRRLDRARRLARALELRCAHGRPEEHQARADQSEEPPVLERDLAARRARLADDALVEDQHGGGDADDRGQLPARPRERVPAEDDVGEDERRDRGGEQQPAQD